MTMDAAPLEETTVTGGTTLLVHRLREGLVARNVMTEELAATTEAARRHGVAVTFDEPAHRHRRVGAVVQGQVETGRGPAQQTFGGWSTSLQRHLRHPGQMSPTRAADPWHRPRTNRCVEELK